MRKRGAYMAEHCLMPRRSTAVVLADQRPLRTGLISHVRKTNKNNGPILLTKNR
jgi:hypothetical protein